VLLCARRERPDNSIIVMGMLACRGPQHYLYLCGTSARPAGQLSDRTTAISGCRIAAVHDFVCSAIGRSGCGGRCPLPASKCRRVAPETARRLAVFSTVQHDARGPSRHFAATQRKVAFGWIVLQNPVAFLQLSRFGCWSASYGGLDTHCWLPGYAAQVTAADGGGRQRNLTRRRRF
jgi:hypothetical protein